MPKELIPLLIPLIVIQLSLQIVAIVNVSRKTNDQLRFQNKLVWLLIIIFGSLLGSIAYFIFGGNPDDRNSSED